MPSGEGWWLDGGKAGHRVIDEHLDAILADPVAYRLGAGLVAAWDGEASEEHRARVFTLAMRKGWVRVRRDRHRTVVELWRLDRPVADRVFGFLDEVAGLGPASPVELNELSTRRGLACAFGELDSGAALLERLRGPGLARKTRVKDGSVYLVLDPRAMTPEDMAKAMNLVRDAVRGGKRAGSSSTLAHPAPDERVCDNCRHRIWVVALGLGVLCGHADNKLPSGRPFRVPSLWHTCLRFEEKMRPR